MSFHVRRAAIGDEATLRAVRLAALEDSLQFFCTSYAREAAYSTADWRRWITGSAVFLLESDGETRGMACGKRDDAQPERVHLLGMWVHPESRGSGAAAALVAAVKEFAAASGATHVRLGIVEGNARAQRCYERAGFRLTGHSQQLDCNANPEIEMICDLQ